MIVLDLFYALYEAFTHFSNDYPILSNAATIVAILFLVLSITLFIDKCFIAATQKNTKIFTKRRTVTFIATSLVVFVIFTFINNYKPEALPEIKALPDYPLIAQEYTVNWDFNCNDNKHDHLYVLKARNITNNTTWRSEITSTNRATLPVTEISGKLILTVARINKKQQTYKWSNEINFEIYKNTMDKINRTKVLHIAIHEDPQDNMFTYFNEDSYQGFDIDLIQIIKKSIEKSLDKEIQVEFKHYDWPDVIGAPSNSGADISIASISINKERELYYKIRFTNPYLITALAAVGPKHIIEDGYIEVNELKTHTLGVHYGTTTATWAVKSLPNTHIETAEDNHKLFNLISENSVDIVLYDYARSHVEAAKYGLNTALVRQNSNLSQIENYGLSIAANNLEFKNFVDNILNDEKDEIKVIKENRLIKDLPINPM